MAETEKAATTEAASGLARKRPSRISKLVEGGSTESINAAHLSTYGFKISEQFATDLAAFVKKPGALPKMLQGDAETVQANIRNTYGFAVSTEYARDLAAYAAQASKGE